MSLTKGMSRRFFGQRMTDEELQEMIDEADRHGEGEANNFPCFCFRTGYHSMSVC